MVMLPHAGYIYCGDIIGETLAHVRLPSTLFLLGPNHTGRGQGLAVWPDGAWLTPLGQTPVQAELAARLVACGAGFTADTQAHLREHSLEVLLPFLQTCVADLTIIPICVGIGDPSLLHRAGCALGCLLRACRTQGRPVAMIVSSDMHHFSDAATTTRLDTLALEHILQLDAQALLRTVYTSGISMCGVGPAALALYAGQQLHSTHARLVRHATSADVTGNTSNVVGYAGIYTDG